MLTIIIIALIAVIALFAVKSLRMQFITQPVFHFFKKVLPPLSDTEREANQKHRKYKMNSLELN